MFRWKSYSDCNMFGKLFIIFLLLYYLHIALLPNSQDSFFITKKYIIYDVSSWKVDINSQNRFLFPKQIPFPKTFTHTWKNRPVYYLRVTRSAQAVQAGKRPEPGLQTWQSIHTRKLKSINVDAKSVAINPKSISFNF